MLIERNDADRARTAAITHRYCIRCDRSLYPSENVHCEDCSDEIWAEDAARSGAPELFGDD